MVQPRRLPWSGRDVPHAILDVGRGCDCVCRACYNASPNGFRSLTDLTRDLMTLRRLRRLHTITIAGGEPLLHPDLPAVVRLVKSHVPRCALLTNGQRLDDDACARLAAAGLDVVFLHIDAGQRRNDLPVGHGTQDRDELRLRLARRCRDHGLEVGLEVTVYRSNPGELISAVRLVTGTPTLRYLLVTLCCDLGSFHALRGDVTDGIHATSTPTGLATEVLALRDVLPLLQREGLSPTAYLGSSSGRHGPRWLSFGRVVRHQMTATSWRELRPGLLTAWLPRLAQLCTGRFPFFLPRSLLRSRVLGALTPGRGGEVLDKWFVIQQGPQADGRGRVVHCAWCPDAVVKRGHLVPVCLSDGWVGP